MLSMAGTWDFIRCWLTVPVVFVLVNIVIGTIAVTSAWWKSKNPNANVQPSVLTRLMSGSFPRRTLSIEDDLAWNSFQRQNSLVQKPCDQAEPQEEQELLGDVQEAADHGEQPSPAADIDRWTSTRAGQRPLEDIQEVSDRDELPSPVAGMEPLTLTRRALHSPRLGKSKSDTPTTESRELRPPPPPPGVKKSGSFDSVFSETGSIGLDSGVPRGGQAVKAEDGASTAEVDAEAEDFIQRFKNQLKLQRLQSMLRYREMIDRVCDPPIIDLESAKYDSRSNPLHAGVMEATCKLAVNSMAYVEYDTFSLRLLKARLRYFWLCKDDIFIRVGEFDGIC